MEKIVLNSQNYSVPKLTDEKPIIYIGQIELVSISTNWSNRLSGSYLSLKAEALDEDDEVLASQMIPLSLASLNNVDLIFPIFDVKTTYHFNVNAFHPERIVKWKMTIELIGFEFAENESLTLKIIDRPYVLKRVNDWQNRIDELFARIRFWINEVNNLEVVDMPKVKMHERLMKDFQIPVRELDSIAIKENGKIKYILKPFGLWILNANGRIDLISANGNNVLTDQAKHFEEPQWTLYLTDDRRSGVELTRDSFLQLIEK